MTQTRTAPDSLHSNLLKRTAISLISQGRRPAETSDVGFGLASPGPRRRLGRLLVVGVLALRISRGQRPGGPAGKRCGALGDGTFSFIHRDQRTVGNAPFIDTRGINRSGVPGSLVLEFQEVDQKAISLGLGRPFPWVLRFGYSFDRDSLPARGSCFIDHGHCQHVSGPTPKYARRPNGRLGALGGVPGDGQNDTDK